MSTRDTIEIFIAAYGTEGGAKDALKDFKAAQRAGSIDLIDGAVIVHTAEGKVKFEETADPSGKKWAKRGAIAGGVVGLIFPPSIIAGAIVGGGAGGIWGKVRDKGFKDEDLRAIGDSLPPGTSAIIAVAQDRVWRSSRAALPDTSASPGTPSPPKRPRRSSRNPATDRRSRRIWLRISEPGPVIGRTGLTVPRRLPAGSAPVSPRPGRRSRAGDPRSVERVGRAPTRADRPAGVLLDVDGLDCGVDCRVEAVSIERLIQAIPGDQVLQSRPHLGKGHMRACRVEFEVELLQHLRGRHVEVGHRLALDDHPGCAALTDKLSDLVAKLRGVGEKQGRLPAIDHQPGSSCASGWRVTLCQPPG